MLPAILYSVRETIYVCYEEIFGPVLLIFLYNDIKTIVALGKEHNYGMQFSIFATKDEGDAAALVHLFSTVFSKNNTNS